MEIGQDFFNVKYAIHSKGNECSSRPRTVSAMLNRVSFGCNLLLSQPLSSSSNHEIIISNDTYSTEYEDSKLQQ